MVKLIFPLLASSKKTQAKIKGNRMFATTTSWVKVKNQPVIHLSISTVTRLAICNHGQKSISNNKAEECKLQNQSSSTVTKASQNIYKHEVKSIV